MRRAALFGMVILGVVLALCGRGGPLARGNPPGSPSCVPGVWP